MTVSQAHILEQTYMFMTIRCESNGDEYKLTEHQCLLSTYFQRVYNEQNDLRCIISDTFPKLSEESCDVILSSFPDDIWEIRKHQDLYTSILNDLQAQNESLSGVTISKLCMIKPHTITNATSEIMNNIIGFLKITPSKQALTAYGAKDVAWIFEDLARRCRGLDLSQTGLDSIFPFKGYAKFAKTIATENIFILNKLSYRFGIEPLSKFLACIFAFRMACARPSEIENCLRIPAQFKSSLAMKLQKMDELRTWLSYA